MLESLTIFNKGGLILYQYIASPSLLGASDGVAHTNHHLNTVLLQKILATGTSTKTFHIDQGVTFSWTSTSTPDDIVVVALYPDIMFEGPRQYLKLWSENLVKTVLDEYLLLYRPFYAEKKSLLLSPEDVPTAARPDPKLFEKTFLLLLESSKTKSNATVESSQEKSSEPVAPTNKNTAARKGKDKRVWGEAKVTAEAMEALDKSGAKPDDEAAKLERALQEARQAYMPDASELTAAAQDTKKSTSNWGSSVTSLLNNIAVGSSLTESDLAVPLEKMRDLLISKNVSRPIAQQLVDACQSQLVGKRLNTLGRVQTAVQQAMEQVLTKLLQSNRLNVLRQAQRTARAQRPFVIAVMGINGIGKTTTLAKLAYYFQQHGSSPLLVAGDTFRSGAVEQLKVHAACLELPIFSEGYSKDPSAVAKLGIQEAAYKGNDVVLIDTAGRMQNNVPLMKALGKIVEENKPDLCLFVCEALVGNDGLDQYRMFQKAVGGKMGGIILTKWDTVSDKVGAALTLVQETGVPVVFCGTGQKYHQLEEMQVAGLLQKLFE